MKRMKYVIPLSAVAVLLLATIAMAQSMDQTQIPDQAQGPTPSGVEATPVHSPLTVNIHDHAFDPDQIIVDPGTTVTWVNKEDSIAHTITADDGSFDSGTLNPGDSYSVRFDGSGQVAYHCKLHPDMTGRLIVGGTGGGEPTTAGGGATTPAPEQTTSTPEQTPQQSYGSPTTPQQPTTLDGTSTTPPQQPTTLDGTSPPQQPTTLDGTSPPQQPTTLDGTSPPQY
jgi:plastocyanin